MNLQTKKCEVADRRAMLANLTKACTVDFAPGSLPHRCPINW